MYETEPRYNESRFNEILRYNFSNTFKKRNRKIDLNITNKCQHVTER